MDPGRQLSQYFGDPTYQHFNRFIEELEGAMSPFARVCLSIMEGRTRSFGVSLMTPLFQGKRAQRTYGQSL